MTNYNAAVTPFSELSPDLILDAVESLEIQTDGRLLALNSYENRVYQIGVEDGPPLVGKFYRPFRWSWDAIQEEHEFVLSLADAEIPVVPPLVYGGNTIHQYQGFTFALFKKQGGRAPEIEQPGTLEWIGRFLGRIHAQGAVESYQYRPTINLNDYGRMPSEYLLEHFIPEDIKPAYIAVVKMLFDGVEQCFERAGKVDYIRLHGDCHVGNLLWTDDGPHFVDFDDSLMGPAVQDFWMLLSGQGQELQIQIDQLLRGYECFYEFDPNQLHLIEALRSLRLIYYAYWIAKRWDDPAFPRVFTWFNTQQYWQNMILELREQVANMNEPLQWKGNGNC